MRRLIWGLGLYILIGLLPACNPQASSSDAVRVRWVRDPESLNPLIIPNDLANQAIGLLYQNLLTVDNQKQVWVPWLAEKLPAVQHQDSLTLLTYRLRSAARWDNGQPIVAQDVAFTLKVMNSPGLPNEAARTRFSFIQDVRLDSTDARQFTLVCRGRAPEYVHDSGDYPILPEYALDPKRELRTIPLAVLTQPAPVSLSQYPVLADFVRRYNAANLDKNPMNLPGSGPYQLTAWRSGQALTFRRKTNWWADQLSVRQPPLLAVPKQIDFQIIPDNATALLALRRGDIDLYPMVPANEFDRLRTSENGKQALRFYTADSYEMVLAGFNTSRAPLNDRLTRQALNYLFDIQALIKATQNGMAYPSVGLINPQEKALYNDSLPLLTFAPQQAEVLLRQANWARQGAGNWTRPTAGGQIQALELTITYRAGDATFETIALQLRNAAAQIGIPIQLRPTESTLLLSKLRAGDFDIYLRTLSGNPFAYDFSPILHSSSIDISNFTRFGTPASDKLIKAIVREEDPARKAQLLRKFQVMMRTESPIVVLFVYRYRLAADRRLTNLRVSGLRPGYDITTIEPLPES
ncbi:peptide-binding protein [Hymenobacter qilianensis]|uniref:ABC transporter substrate-binding protein n=2 Tax=Hymenobacter qilianensis TaxID=1385715 RepID=A0A7H0GR11_9BACT|nr:ABC transporter substrate-binding protein [Hymenobacter qilianensis]QNP50727.1 ABC transporter substrate-binding protein [Hymenobacter qilianensis]GGF51219.1 peptide-binding protein [Hymenobacter qilianensis]